MKAEHRKELQTNSLARWLSRMGQNLRQAPSRNTAVVWGIILLAVGAVALWWILSSLSANRNSQRWLGTMSISSPEERSRFIEEHKGTTQAQALRLQQARANLEDGLATLYTERKAATEKLKAAASAYESLVRDFDDNPVIVQESLLGAGKAYEGLGELDKALASYKELSGRFPESAFGKRAAEQAKHIKTNRAEIEKLHAAMKQLKDSSPADE